MADIILNTKQKILVEEITAYIKNEKHTDKEFITISGAAGSGKTESLKQALQKIAYSGKYIMGGAISNSATNILSKSIPFADVMTISKGLKERKIIDNNTGEEYFAPSVPPDQRPVYSADVYIVDECSMISPNKHQMIKESLKPGCKLIYIGDRAQHCVIETGEISETFKNTILELTEIMRSKELLNSINNVYRTEILSIIDYGEMINPFVLKEKLFFNDEYKENDSIRRIIEKEDFINKYIKEYNKDKENPLNAKIIPYTNASVNYYNDIIRTKLFGATHDKYVIGDMLLIEKPYFSDDDYITSNTYVTVSNVRRGVFKDINVYLLDVFNEILSIKDIPVLDYSTSYRDYKIKLSKLQGLAVKKIIPWKEFYDFKDGFASVSYGYSVTSYKVQGATINSAFVCETEIKNTVKPSSLDKLQSLYVSSTRAAHNIYSF